MITEQALAKVEWEVVEAKMTGRNYITLELVNKNDLRDELGCTLEVEFSWVRIEPGMELEPAFGFAYLTYNGKPEQIFSISERRANGFVKDWTDYIHVQ